MAWDIKRLIKLSSNLKIKSIALSNIKEIDECFWYDLGGDQPTCRSIVGHIKIINEADLQHPIILCEKGRVMDGMHRVCNALIKGHTTIKAVQFTTYIPPDYLGIKPEDLPYEN